MLESFESCFSLKVELLGEFMLHVSHDELSIFILFLKFSSKTHPYVFLVELLLVKLFLVILLYNFVSHVILIKVLVSLFQRLIYSLTTMSYKCKNNKGCNYL